MVYPAKVNIAEPAPHSPSSLLLVEDEAPILNGLSELFRGQGFRVATAADGAAALALLESEPFDLVILDLMLPKLTGFEVLERMRRRGTSTPVLVLTAKDTEDDVVRGIEAGADDYVTKPFGIRELLARTRGLLRRTRPADAPRSMQIGQGSLDVDAARFTEDGAAVLLTAREAQLLAYLALSPGRIVGREELLVHVWGYRDGTVRTRTVDVHIQQLREKIPHGGRRIATVRGRGYRLERSA
jgi:DNA-binding response OmpR family regulator